MLNTSNPCTDPEGGGEVGLDPMENLKAIGFLSNTSPDPLENHKATKPALTVWALSALQQESQFKCCFAGVPMMARAFLISPKKTFSELSWTPSDKTFCIRA